MQVPELGERINDALAGFFGGLVHAARFRPASAWQGVVVIFCGTVVAHFFTEDLTHFVPLSRGAAGFLIGFAAYEFARSVIDLLTGYAERRIGGK